MDGGVAMDSMTVLDPIGERPAGQIRPVRRTLFEPNDSLGLLSNGKPNAEPLLRGLATLLSQKYGIKNSIFLDKAKQAEGAGRPAPEQWIPEISSLAKAVLVASGD